MNNRPRRTPAKMYPLVEAYISGSQSRTAFCAEHNLPISALNYWQTKYRRSQGLTKKRKQNNFVPVQFSPSPKASAVMELELTGGTRLRFYSYPDPAYLKSILSLKLC